VNRSHIHKKIYNWYKNTIGFKKSLPLYLIQFNTGWWAIFKPHTWTYVITILSESIVWVFMTYAPIWLVQHFQQPSINNIIWFTVIFVTIWIIKVIVQRMFVRANSCTISSLKHSAFAHFLKIDPVYHGRLDMGITLSKINKGVTKAEAIPDIICYDALPLVIKVIVISFAFLQVDITLGLVCLGFLIVLIVTTCVAQRTAVMVFIPPEIIAENDLAKVTVEALQQVNKIWSTFNVLPHIQAIKTEAKRHAAIYATTTFGLQSTLFIPKLMYVFSCGILLAYLTIKVQSSVLDTALAVGLSATYFSAYQFIMSSGKKLEKYLKATTKLQDLFDYINHSGKSTIPLLSRGFTFESSIATTLRIHELSVRYPKGIGVFDKFSYSIDLIPSVNNPAVVGIVGSSGTGKTTLLQVLSGQLRPQSGQVLLGGVDVYSVGEADRGRLLASQQQYEWAIGESVLDNLLWSLPKNPLSTAAIIELLQRLNLWDSLAQKQGLNTPLGTQGLTLSGGQRQRLNVLSLYMRYLYFQPKLVMLDEPTSSLDKKSEDAVLELLLTMGTTSLVLVVSHNQSTLRHSVEILDLAQIICQQSQLQ
jgi:ABC-type bacteriocin/lantibiotic exporter with double-glycine peptidase domain